MAKRLLSIAAAMTLSVAVQADETELPAVPLSVLDKKPAASTDLSAVTSRLEGEKATPQRPRARTQYSTEALMKDESNKTITMLPGVNQIVIVATGHLNRIVTPFDNPKVRTTSNVTTQVEGNVVYMATQNTKPVTMYVTPHDDESVALSLTLVPRAVPPVELTLEVDQKTLMASSKMGNTRAATWEESQPYVQTLRNVMRALALQEIPQGYTLSDLEDTDPRPVCVQEGMEFDFERGQKLSGHHVKVMVGVVQNLSTAPREIDLTSCANYNVAGMSAWPYYMLEPGMKTEIYVATREPKKRDRSALRPSLLD